MIKYSFLVPVYNVEAYLGKCVDSLVNQNYPSNRYQIILVDDGSTDGSSEICDQYASTYSNVHVIHQDNRGLLQARRTGVGNAEGEYLLFVDSDDYVDPNMLSLADKHIDSIDPDFVMFSYYRTKNNIDKPIYLVDEEQVVLSQSDMLGLFVESDVYNGVARKVVKAEILKEHIEEIYSLSVSVGEDKIQTAHILKYSQRIVLTRDCPYHYVYRIDSVVHEQSIEDIYDVIKIYNNVRPIVEDMIDTNKIGRSKNEIISKYDSTALQGTLDHIFKYNTRKDIVMGTKIRSINQLQSDEREFFLRLKKKDGLKVYNRIRYNLLVSKKYFILLVLDTILDYIKSIKSGFEGKSVIV